MWYFSSIDIKQVHFEISNFCNAKCPDCPRENLGIDNTTGKSRFPDWIDTNYLSLETIKKNFNRTLTPNACDFYFCGCFGDALTHPQLIEIIEYINTEFPESFISISTNGGLRNTKYWIKLAEVLKKTYQHKVIWGIDGLEDTNHIYRVNVNWKKLQENFRAFNKAGGNSMWQTIIFPHNYHQINDIRSRALKEGFNNFQTVLSYRHQEEVKKLIPDNLIHKINVDNDFQLENKQQTKEKKLTRFKGKKSVGFDHFVPNTNIRVVCESQKLHKVFVKSDGTLWPCNKIGAWRWRPDEEYYAQYLKDSLNTDYTNNINKFNIDQVMKNDFWVKIYNSHKDKNFCKSCVEECGRINDKDVYQTRSSVIVEDLKT